MIRHNQLVYECVAILIAMLLVVVGCSLGGDMVW